MGRQGDREKEGGRERETLLKPQKEIGLEGVERGWVGGRNGEGGLALLLRLQQGARRVSAGTGTYRKAKMFCHIGFQFFSF